MSDFNWFGTCEAVHATGFCDDVVAADTQGNIYSAFPLDESNNYKFWVWSDPYKATVSKEDGTEVEEDIYEAYNLSLLVTGQTSSIPQGQGVRLNGEKYLALQVLRNQTYVAEVEGEQYKVTIDEIHVLRKGPMNVFIGVKGGYVFIVRNSDANIGVDKTIGSMAVGFYWVVGPDQA